MLGQRRDPGGLSLTLGRPGRSTHLALGCGTSRCRCDECRGGGGRAQPLLPSTPPAKLGASATYPVAPRQGPEVRPTGPNRSPAWERCRPWLDPPGDALGDFLEDPLVPVWIREGRLADV